MTPARGRSPRNTEEEALRHPIIPIAEALFAGDGGRAIMASEAAGQRELVKSDVLPTQISRENREALEKAGVKFGDYVPGDPVFTYVELPSGWQKKPTNHSMWSDLVDDKGRKRAAIFYKAAFYDRSANMHTCSRYGVRFDYDKFEKEGIAVSYVTDSGDMVIHTTEPITAEEGQKSFQLSEKANQRAVAWLDKSFPDWKNHDTYWD